MADPVANQEAGGGEGQKPTQPSEPAPETKPIDPVRTEPEISEAKPEVVPETKTADNPGPNTADAKLVEGEVKAEVAAAELKTEDAAVESKPVVEENGNDLSNGDAATNTWQQREQALLKKIDELEKVKNQSSENKIKMELKLREEEIDLLKARVRSLETELQAALSKPGPKNHEMIENIKQQHEELLSKARGMIFDKTKMVKNQELQIEALTTQVQSLKDINLITKDLLEIRNSEIKAMEDRLQAMEARFNMEKERFSLVLQRAQTSTSINDDLKKEYETQLKIFKELRLKYEQKVEALVAENNKLKLDLAKGSTSSEAK